MVSTRKRFLIPVDHKWRDLPGAIFLKTVLEQKFGHEAILCRQGSELEFCITLLPHCVVFPHILDNAKVDFSRKLKAMDISLVLYPTEGIPSLRRVFEFYSGKFVDMSLVDAQLCWGEGARDIYLDYKTVPPDRLYVTGSSRFDFYREPLNRLIPSRVDLFSKYGLDPSRPTVMWTTNFTKASVYEIDKNIFVDDIKNYKLEGAFQDTDDEGIKDIETREITASFFERLVNEHPNINLIIKHHPMESPSFYERFLTRVRSSGARVGLVRDNFIWDVLPYIDVLAQRSCTTGFEAWFLDKPTVELQVNPRDSYYVNEEADGGNDLVVTYEEFSSHILKYLGGANVPPEQIQRREDFIRKWCFTIDGKSTLRLATFLDEHVSGINNQPHNVRNIETIKYMLRSTIYRLLGMPYYLPAKKVFSRREDPDKIGRFDKWVTLESIQYWEQLVAEGFKNFDWSSYSITESEKFSSPAQTGNPTQ